MKTNKKENSGKVILQKSGIYKIYNNSKDNSLIIEVKKDIKVKIRLLKIK